MLSRLATGSRRLVRRYTTTNGGGSPTGASKPASASPSSSSATVPVTWLATKAKLNAGSWGTRLACLIVLGVSTSAIYDQYENRNINSDMLTALEALETPALDEDKFMLDSQGLSRKIAAGFENLPDLLSARRRSFSGDVVVPVSEETLSKYERRLVKALLNAVEDQYENRWRALSMLHTLAKSSPSVRERLREPNALFLIMECGTHFSVASSPRHEWLVAADLVTTLLSGEEGASTVQSQDVMVKKFMEKYSQSTNPVAMIVHSRLGESLNLPAPSTTFTKRVETDMLNQALLDSLAVDYTKNVSGASLVSALGFAVFGGVWGRLRWAMRLTRMGALNAHAWNWSAKKHIARPLALWFLADMIGTQLLTYASNDKFEFDSQSLRDISDIEARANLSGMSFTKQLQTASQYLSSIPGTQGVSLAETLSLFQNCSFTLFSIWMISTRRYAFLPLAAAGVYNHYDEIQKIPQLQYIVKMGKIQADKTQHMFTKQPSSTL